MFSKKSTSAINIISSISIVGIFIGTAALIIILSVFNGFEQIAISMFSAFSPDIQVTAKQGKTFNPEAFAGSLRRTEGIRTVVQTLEEKSLLLFNKNQYISVLKGFSPEFGDVHDLDPLIVEGKLKLQEGSRDYAVLGAGVQFRLGVSSNALQPITAYAPAKGAHVGGAGLEDFNQLDIYPEGIFSVQQDYDDKYVLTSLRFMRRLLNEPNNVSAFEIFLYKKDEADRIKAQIARTMGPGFYVKNRFEQNGTLYKVLNSEKWAVYLILTFVLIIAVFNIMGSMTMLVIEKKKDIGVLFSMGVQKKTVRQIFFIEGTLIAFFGTLAGIIGGYLFAFLEQKYHFITMGDGKSFVVNSYPVVLKWMDFVSVSSTVLGISFTASWLASQISVKNYNGIARALSEG